MIQAVQCLLEFISSQAIEEACKMLMYNEVETLIKLKCFSFSD